MGLFIHRTRFRFLLPEACRVIRPGGIRRYEVLVVGLAGITCAVYFVAWLNQVKPQDPNLSTRSPSVSHMTDESLTIEVSIIVTELSNRLCESSRTAYATALHDSSTLQLLSIPSKACPFVLTPLPGNSGLARALDSTWRLLLPLPLRILLHYLPHPPPHPLRNPNTLLDTKPMHPPLLNIHLHHRLPLLSVLPTSPRPRPNQLVPRLIRNPMILLRKQKPQYRPRMHMFGSPHRAPDLLVPRVVRDLAHLVARHVQRLVNAGRGPHEGGGCVGAGRGEVHELLDEGG